MKEFKLTGLVSCGLNPISMLELQIKIKPHIVIIVILLSAFGFLVVGAFLPSKHVWECCNCNNVQLP